MQNQSLGVLGGMGPMATVDFLKKLTEKTPATCDQEHIPIVLYGDCTVPDRTAFAKGEGPSPLPKLFEGIEMLCRSGVTAIAVPCNSAHCWYTELVKRSSVPVLNIVRASAKAVLHNDPLTKRVGVLSTEGTYKMGIYRDTLLQMNFQVIEPTFEEFRDLVSPGIKEVKAGAISQSEGLFELAASKLFERGAEQIILGCTEIPLGMTKQLLHEPARYISSTESLVDESLRTLNRI
jgi:aspartate racemase